MNQRMRRTIKGWRFRTSPFYQARIATGAHNLRWMLREGGDG